MEFLRRIANALSPGVPEGMEDRVPLGQYVTPKMPIMTYASTPRIASDEWRLKVDGLVEQPLELDWDAFNALAPMTEVVDFHCVTQWTRLDVGWEGVPVSTVVAMARPKPEARYVMVHCYDGYTTNLDVEWLMAPEVLFATTQDGAPLDRNHGFPMRLVVPALYGWKSAKWVHGLEFMADNHPGFWEQNGYHLRGDPWHEERFSW
jgi:DMSO/TMAO reductase YedYZ molybdopterin-dependent catalytic subunit